MEIQSCEEKNQDSFRTFIEQSWKQRLGTDLYESVMEWQDHSSIQETSGVKLWQQKKLM